MSRGKYDLEPTKCQNCGEQYQTAKFLTVKIVDCIECRS